MSTLRRRFTWGEDSLLHPAGSLESERYCRIRISTTILDHTDRNQRYFWSNANLVRRSLVHDMNFSGIGDVPTHIFWHWLCANSECECALGCMESCRILHIYMLLTCRLQITFTFSLKLIISFLVQLQHRLLPSLMVTASQVRVGMLFLFDCAVSLAWGWQAYYKSTDYK